MSGDAWGGLPYMPYFDGATDPDALGAAVTACFGVPPERVHVGPASTIRDDRPTPYVIVEPPDDLDSCTLMGGEPLRRACGGLSERDLVSRLCRHLGASAFVSDESPSALSWFYVGPDGTVSRVTVEEDAVDDGRLVIAYAYDPIPTRPDVPVVPVPTWDD